MATALTMSSNPLPTDGLQLQRQQAQSSSSTDSKASIINAVPAWGSYLYQNFLLPAFSPSEWLNTPGAGPQHTNTDSNTVNTDNNSTSDDTPSVMNDYFGNATAASAMGNTWSDQNNMFSASSGFSSSSYNVITQPLARSQTHPLPQTASYFPNHFQQSSNAGPSSFYPQPYYNAIPTHLLQQTNSSTPSSQTISPSIDVIEAQIRSSSSEVKAVTQALHAPALHDKRRRASSFDTDGSHDEDHDDPLVEVDGLGENVYEIAEGVERDGMIWGMKVEDYRALSARERKRVRNRISARTFRAKRKEHLSTLETDLNSKDLQIKLAKDEAESLRRQVEELKLRLCKYERI